MKKTALITGSYRGLGLETARQLAQIGYSVIITARSKDKAKLAASSLDSISDQVHYHQLDINSQESVNKIKSWVQSEFGRLDVLVNNAAINYDTWNSALAADLDEIQQTLDTNLMGAWRMAQAFLPQMKDTGYGRIVNVSSGAVALSGMGEEHRAIVFRKQLLMYFPLNWLLRYQTRTFW